LRRLAASVARRAPRVVVAHRTALARRLAEAGIGRTAADPGLARETALFADRCDIREELTRLASHFRQAGDLLRGPQACGRTLDFLCQEIFREVNTVGSKAGDAVVARLVVALKTELEAIREQVQNVE
jgi:uncharacterized protein (TIGR00255 family)